MSDMEQKYEVLDNERVPQGLKTLAQDVYIDIDLYKAYIMGFVSSYLKGVQIDPNEINMNTRIDIEFEACLEKLNEYMAYKKRIDELALLLKERIASEQSE